MSTVITVENLGKKYTISHRQHGEYVNLRDALTTGLSSFSRKLLHPFKRSEDLVTAVEDFWALKDVSFQVNHGECLGIIGGNGAGKSTLLKILSRITEPSTGSIRIKGRVASLLEVGTGFQPELTGRENIYLNGAILGMSRQEIRNKFDEIVDFSEIEKFLDTPVKRYSSGMYVRLAFAVAAHLEPEILIVDEVLAVGDAQFQKKCLGKMEDVSVKEGRTVLFVSHNIPTVERLCNRGLLLGAGKIVCSGEISSVAEAYFSSFRSPASSSARMVSGRHLKMLRILNGVGELCSVFAMGTPLLVELDLCDLRDVPGTQVSLSLVTLGGQRVFTLNTGMVCHYLERKRGGTETFLLRIDSLNLVPGRYAVEVSIAQKGVSRIEHFENISEVEIVERDVYGSGYMLSSHYGMIFVQGGWTVRNSERTPS